MSTPPTAERPTGAAAAQQKRAGRPAEKPAAEKPPAKKPASRTPNGKAPNDRKADGRKAAGRTGNGREAARLVRLLTPGEARLLAHLAAGLDLDGAAAALGLTPAAARTSLHRAMRKLGARTRAEATAFAPLLSPPQPPQPPPATPAPPAPAPAAPAQAAAPPAPLGFEEFYAAAHTRLVQQTFLLTACRHRAVHCVGRAFGEAARRWDAVTAGGDPEGWVRTRAFEAALSPWHRGGPRRAHAWRLPHRRIKVRPADESQAVLPDHDRLTDRDRALLRALRRLSRPQRRALVLHDGLGLPAAAVAVEVESSVGAAEGRVWAARTALARWVPDLVGADPTADGFADGLSALLHRAAVRGCPEPRRPAVPVLRARHGLRNALLTGGAAVITAAMGTAVVATLVGGGPAELFRPTDPAPPPVCATSAGGSAVPAAPGGPPNGVRSLWCSTAPGLPPVVVAPPPPRTLHAWQAAPGDRALPPPGPAPDGTVDGGPLPAGPGGCGKWAPQVCLQRLR